MKWVVAWVSVFLSHTSICHNICGIEIQIAVKGHNMHILDWYDLRRSQKHRLSYWQKASVWHCQFTWWPGHSSSGTGRTPLSIAYNRRLTFRSEVSVSWGWWGMFYELTSISLQSFEQSFTYSIGHSFFI